MFLCCRTSVYASAVCVYNTTSFNNAFSGSFKYQENAQMAWTRMPNSLPNMQVMQPTHLHTELVIPTFGVSIHVEEFLEGWKVVCFNDLCVHLMNYHCVCLQCAPEAGPHARSFGRQNQTPAQRHLVDAQKFQMMDDAVQPTQQVPVVVAENERCIKLCLQFEIDVWKYLCRLAYANITDWQLEQ